MGWMMMSASGLFDYYIVHVQSSPYIVRLFSVTINSSGYHGILDYTVFYYRFIDFDDVYS